MNNDSQSMLVVLAAEESNAPPFSEWRNGLESDPGLKVRPEEATGRDDARKRGCEESAAKKTVTAPAKREPALSSRSEWGHKDWR